MAAALSPATAAAAAIACTPVVLHAQQAVRIDIPAGQLGASLRLLARQTGISVAGTDAGISSIRVPAVRGQMTAEEALRRLLARTAYRARRINERTYRIERRPPPPAASAATPRRSETVGARPAIEAVPIIVTASKRDIDLRDYPGGARLLEPNRLTPGALGDGLHALLANEPVVSGTALGSGRNKVFVRGVADSSFNGPTQSTVGIYLGEQRLTYSAPNPDLRLYDVESVELLEGPQGTLYGMGTIGGLVRINPRRPSPGVTEGSLWTSSSLVAHGDVGGDLGVMVNLPLTDGIAMRSLAYGGRSPGYIDDVRRDLDDVNRTDFYGGRVALAAGIGSNLTVELSGFGQKTDMADGQYIEPRRGRLVRGSVVAQPFSGRILGGGLTLRASLGDVNLVSTTGMIGHRLDTTFDTSRLTGQFLPQTFNETREVDLLSHETRLARTGSGGLSWFVGVGAMRNRDDYSQFITNGNSQEPRSFAQIFYEIEDYAVFGEASYEFLPGWTGTLGGRLAYSRNHGRRSFGPDMVIQPGKNPARFLPAAALSWHPAPDVLAYVRYEEGYRASGVTIERDRAGDLNSSRFDPDRVRSYEAGLRGTVDLGVALDFGATVFRLEWDDMQADLKNPQGFPFTRNIGDGSNTGITANVGFSSADGWDVDLAGAHNDTALERRLPNGGTMETVLPNVPEWTGHLRVAKEWQLPADQRLTVSLSGRYVGRSFLDLDQRVDVPQGNYTSADMAVTWQRSELELALEVLNVTDSDGNRFAYGNPFDFRQENQHVPLRPLTVRFSSRIDF